MSRLGVQNMFTILGVFFLGIMVFQLFEFANNVDVLAYPLQAQSGNSTFGIISSIQNNEMGDPYWIVSGHWKTNLLNFVNQSETANQGNLSQTETSPTPAFNTSVKMITLNGTGEHTHTLTNFELTDIRMPNNMTTMFEGLSTASLRGGPVSDIPTIITITNDKVISIWLDPSKINNHYGDTPVYGTVMKETDFR